MAGESSANSAVRTMESLLEHGGESHHSGVAVEGKGVKKDGAMPQLDSSTYSSQVFWLLACFLVLYVLISKSALPRIHEVVEKRRHRIDSDLDSARRLSQEAQEAREAYEDMQKRAKGDAAEFLRQAHLEVARHRDEAFESVDAEIVQMLGKSDADIQQRRHDLAKTLEPLAVELVEEVVSAISGVQPNASDVEEALKA